MKIYPYLMGAISYYYNNNQIEEATEWRDWFCTKLLEYDIECFNPMKNFKVNLQFPGRSIVTQNNYFLSQCNIGIVNLKNIDKSLGTLYEMFQYHFYGKPIIAFEKMPEQPHILSAIDCWLKSKEDVLDYLISMYL